MRRIYFIILIAGILIAFTAPVKAQISFRVGINLSSQPVWGPVGYDNVQYYYLPDIDAYYYVPRHQFIYQERGRWIFSSNLPPRYHDYDLYNGYKVVINEDRPYRRNRDYREKYGSYRDRHDQQPIRDSRDSKYFANKNHPEHNKWVEQQRHNNGRGREQSNYNRRNDNRNQDNQRNQDNHDKQNNKGDQGRHEDHKK